MRIREETCNSSYNDAIFNGYFADDVKVPEYPQSDETDRRSEIWSTT